MRWAWTDDLQRGDGTPQKLLAAFIWLVALALVAAGWAVTLKQISRERAEAEQAAIEQVQNRTMAFEQYVARTFEAADLVTRHVAEMLLLEPEAFPQGAAPPIPLQDALVRRELFTAVHLVSPDGRLLASTVDLDRPVDVSDHPVFRGQISTATDRLLISPPLPSDVRPGNYVHASRRALDAAGVTRGFVDVQIDPAHLSNFLQDANFLPTDLISVIGLDGITRARREGNRISSGENLKGRLVMQMQLHDPNITYVGPSSIDGHVRYFSHRRLKDYPIFVTAGVSRDVAMAPVERRARLYLVTMALLTAAALLIALLVVSTLARRQRRADALAEANQRLRHAQRIAKIGDWEYDLETEEILWSDQLCEMYERTGCDRLSLDEFQSYLDEEGRRTIEDAVARAVRTGEPQTNEFRVHLPSGAVSYRLAHLVPLRDENGRVTLLRGTDQDITADRMLHTLQAQVAHLGRVDAMNIMASTLAHELNQPLTAASNYLSGGERLLGNDTPEARSRLREAIRAAREQVQTAGLIIRRVRDMLGSRYPAVSEPASLAKAVEDSLSLLIATGVCTRGAIKREIDPAADLVWADPVQVQQVLLNLMRNACEAASHNSAPEIRISSRPHGDAYVAVAIADNGPGIDRPAEEIFSPYSTGKAGGLGLGLSISRTIVEYHRGRIWVEKSDASGTTILFTLPRNRLEHPADPGTPAAA